MIHDDIISLIGNTPYLRINKLNPTNIEIVAKLEGWNPGGSIKDRIALEMITAAEKLGLLDKTKTIIEATSGNTGIGLAMIAAVKGYNIEIVLSEAVSIERRKLLEAYGAKIILSPANEGTDGAIVLAKEMIRRSPDKYYMPNQFENPSNPMAHYKTTADEIVKDIGEFDYFVSGIGTTGTLMGIGRRLKEHNPKIQIVGIEPTLGHKTQGLKNLDEAIVPKIYDETVLDEKMTVEDKHAYNTARRLIQEEGISVGISSGAAMYGALQLAQRLEEKGLKGRIVTIFPDRGEKYISTSLFIKDKMGLKIYNTLSREKEEFVPLKKGTVLYYSCGPTVYNYAHIGNFRSFVFADVLKRYLKYKGYKVTHVMNITDVDDKTIRNSKEQGKTLKEFTDYYTDAFFKDFETLNIEKPDIIPRATETIPEMVEMIKTLMDKGYAYKSDDGSIYFDISKYDQYGKLSKTDVKNLKAGARVSHDEYEKANVSDFALWKAWDENDGDVFWETEIGKGRPGWHIECSAMSTKYLGDNFDIHTGGVDLVFPHHENEIAQSEAATGKPFVNYWAHCEHLIVDGKKMSKSMGNFYTLRDLLDKGMDPMAIRYTLLATSYKQQLNFTFDGIESSKQTINRLYDFVSNLNTVQVEEGPLDGIKKLLIEVKDEFEQNMDDNLNISGAMASVFEFVNKINKLIGDGRVSKEGADLVKETMLKFDSVLGIQMDKHTKKSVDKAIDVTSINIDEEFTALKGAIAKAKETGDMNKINPIAEKIIAYRLHLREKKDWTRSDEVRDRLKELGIIVDDSKQGASWKLD
ncbi:cysteine--tRNA ligase [Candidatus Woesearchaeota archaeon]|nr:cysteine--tRNA ligase [Candidatus Woesearchaeota archaeon]